MKNEIWLRKGNIAGVKMIKYMFYSRSFDGLFAKNSFWIPEFDMSFNLIVITHKTQVKVSNKVLCL